MKQNPGLRPAVKLNDFGPKEIEIVHNLATIFFVSNAKVGKAGKDRYPVVYLKPTDDLQQRFCFFSELLCVLHPYPVLDARVIDFIDRTLSASQNRLDRLCVLIVSNASDVEANVPKVSITSEARVFVPFRYNELTGSVAGKGDIVRRRLEENLYTKDLFAISSALKTDRYFFGRRTDVQRIIGKYNEGENSSIFGLRRIGKTSVLWAVVRELRDIGAPVAFIDCTDTRFHKARWNQTLFRIKQALFQANPIAEGGHGEHAYSEAGASVAFSEDLLLVKKTYGKPSLLIFDEIENLSFDLSPTNHWASGADYLAFWQTIRSTFQQNPNLFSFLVCGVNPRCVEVPLIGPSLDNPLYRYVEPTYLGFFDVDDVTAMLKYIGGYMGMSFDTEVYTYLTDEYGGHPFLIRQVCSKLHQWHLKKLLPRKVHIRKEIYREKRDELRLSTRDYIDLILRILRERYVDEYRLLQHLSADDHQTFSSYALDEPTLINHLLGYGLVTKASDKYHFRIIAVQDAIADTATHLRSPATLEERWELLNAERNSFEQELRNIVKRTLKIAFGTPVAKDKFVNAMIKRSQKDKAATYSYDDMFRGEVYFSDLKRAIIGEWETFKNIFRDDKARFEHAMTTVNKLRADAHANEIDADNFSSAMESIRWLKGSIEENC
ncbi:ATP-binding protein [Paraburkholderia sp. BL10I2N1]|uniref:ATP-binding protein n=1 Tax=Paraburkholderia sp. BL10I2N1 TaxID=1938796 RepID=UPI001060FD2F|nr:ATP-binding protein [Paraburkholderia sp. BL10I2N1]TDN70796.1 hypothetical protein B0G77_4293 [Paraburkholderia sp. BL10I2N1]